MSTLHKAMRLKSILSRLVPLVLADAYDAMGRSEDVIATIHRMHDPSEGQPLAAAITPLGMIWEAEAAASEVLSAHPQFTRSASGVNVRPIATQLSVERSVEGLRKAGLPE